ncbi:MAG: RNA polymerase sigma factor [Desulfovibrio sp.]
MNQSEKDSALVRETLNGDAEAFGLLVARYQRPLLNLMYRNTGSRELAQDLAQDAFLKAFEKLETFRLSARFFSWLYAIGMNRLRDHFRAKGRSSESPWQEIDALPDTCAEEFSEERMNVTLDARTIESRLLCLPLPYREALILRYKEDCSMEEIAESLDVSVSGAKMRVHRGLDMLRDFFKEPRHE